MKRRTPKKSTMGGTGNCHLQPYLFRSGLCLPHRTVPNLSHRLKKPRRQSKSSLHAR